jgi:hypothetical protein
MYVVENIWFDLISGRTRNEAITSTAGEQQEWTLPLWDVYGSISHGLWNIYVVTSDGSRGSVAAAVRTLD